MKYLVIVAVVVCAGSVAALSWRGEGPVTDPLHRGPERTSRPLRPSEAMVAAAVDRQEAEARAPELPTALPSDLDVFLEANPGSPLGLLPPEEAAGYLPTHESFLAWYRQVEEMEAVDLDSVVYDDDLAYLWQLCVEHQALRTFCLEYEGREYERWRNLQVSIPLETELQPALGFIRAQFGDDVDVWDAIDSYSRSVIEYIYGEGADGEEQIDGVLRWDLFKLFLEVGSPSFDAVAEVIYNT